MGKAEEAQELMNAVADAFEQSTGRGPTESEEQTLEQVVTQELHDRWKD